jgi:hypothetical protein
MPAADTKHPTYAVDAIPSDIKNGVFLGNPVTDNVVSCVIALATEMWSTKRRLKVVEAVMAQHGVTPDMVEKYTPTDQQKAEWEKDRDRFIELTLGSLGNQGFRSMAADFPKRG